MKTKYFLYIAPVLIVFLLSCEKEIKFNGNEVKTKLVLNGLLTPDSVVKIQLTASKFFLDMKNGSDFYYLSPDEKEEGNFRRINNAIVELWKNGNKIEELSNIGKGYYVGTYVPQTGDNLRITASCEGFDPIECSNEIVTPTPIISIDTMNFRRDKGYYYQYSEDGSYYIDSSSYYSIISFDMDITFKDPKDIPNYYTINLYVKYYLANGDSLYSQIAYGSDDMVFHTENDMSFLGDDRNYLKSTLFNDDLLDGKEYKLKIKIDNYINATAVYWINNESLDVVDVGKEMFVELQSLSPEFYMFRKTRDASYNMDETMKYFTEPIQIYSNIEGGLGILGSYSSSFYTIPLK